MEFFFFFCLAVFTIKQRNSLVFFALMRIYFYEYLIIFQSDEPNLNEIV